jgi:hypothetical protein
LTVGEQAFLRRAILSVWQDQNLVRLYHNASRQSDVASA